MSSINERIKTLEESKIVDEELGKYVQGSASLHSLSGSSESFSKFKKLRLRICNEKGNMTLIGKVQQPTDTQS